MTDSGIPVITMMLMDVLTAVLPVFRMFPVKLHHLPDHRCVTAVPGQVGKSLLQNFLYILFHKRIADTGCHEHTAMDTIPIMGDTGCLRCQLHRQIRLSRRHQSPGINENLASDLLRCHFSVLPDASAGRSRNSGTQIQISGMLC